MSMYAKNLTWLVLIVTALVCALNANIQTEKTAHESNLRPPMSSNDGDVQQVIKDHSYAQIAEISKPRFLKDEATSESIVHIDKNINKYVLAQPENSISEFQKHVLIEGCHTISTILSEHADIPSYINHMTNLGLSLNENWLYRTERNCKEVGILNLDLIEVQNLAEKALLNSIILGNEEAMSKYSVILSNKSYDTNIYNHGERLKFRTEAIDILKTLSDKNHLESKLALAYLYSDYTHFPELYDSSKITELIVDAERISGENYQKLMDKLINRP